MCLPQQSPGACLGFQGRRQSKTKERTMKPQQVFTLVLSTTFSVLAYPAILSLSDNLPVEKRIAAAIDTRTTAEIYAEYFGSAENAEVPVINDELASRFINGVWHNISETDQGNRNQAVLGHALSKKPKAANHSISSTTIKPNSSMRSGKASTQLKRYRNQTISQRTRSRTVTAAASRLKQSLRNRKQLAAKKKRQRDRSRRYLPGTKRRSVFNSTRRFKHTRSGTTPGS